MIKQIRNSKFVIRNCQAGMTYVELIVVLSIFSVLTSVVLFNYGDFQAKVDIKILANDIASKIIETQKAALSGKLPTLDQQNTLVGNSSWKPSYGLYFNKSAIDDTDVTPTVAFNKEIIYFTSFDNSDNYYKKSSPDSILDRIRITKNNSITGVEAVGCQSIDDLSIVFKRPDSRAFINDSNGNLFFCGSLEYAKITVSSSGLNPFKAYIRVYPSGRVEIE